MRARNHWKEVLLFILIASIYTVCCQPDISWAGYDCDLGDFLTSAKYGTLPHFPGSPIYSMSSWLVCRIPLGTIGWRLAFFLSVVPSILSCILVFYAVKKQTKNSWAPFIGSVSVAAANAFFVQSIIMETYAFSAFVAILAYFFIVYKKYSLAAVSVGLGISVHPFTIFPAVALLIWSKKVREKWRYCVGIFVVSYIYIIAIGLTKESLSTHSSGGLGLVTYIIGALSENSMYWGSLSINHIPYKLWTIAVAFVSMFGLALIPMVKAVNKKNSVLWGAALVPIIYFVGNELDLTVKHVVIIVPFLGVLAGLGVERIRFHPGLVFAFSLAMLVCMPMVYDIGETMDKQLSAKNFYDQLDAVPEGSIVVVIDEFKGGQFVSGRENTLIKLHNKERDNKLVPIYGLYVSDLKLPGYGNVGKRYRDGLEKDYGISTPLELNDNFNSSENLWNNVPLIKEANPDRSIFYIRIPEDDPFMRIVTEYK